MLSLPSQQRRAGFGIAGLVALSLVVFLSFSVYQGAFTSSIPVTVQADRAGLGLVSGSPVLVRGVKVGKVESVDLSDAGGADLSLRIKSSAVEQIPTDATASIDATSLLGPKAVELDVSQALSESSIRAGDVLRTTDVSAEINDVYQDLTTVLTSVDAGSLNATLGSIAQSLDGRGEAIGQYVGQLNTYVGAVNQTLPSIETDLRLIPRVADQYNEVAPELLETVRNLSTTSATLVDLQPTLHKLLVDMARTISDVTNLVDTTADPLTQAISTLRPVARVAAEYAPEYACVLQGMSRGYTLARAISDTSSITTKVGLAPGQQPYKYPRDLPKLVEGLGPDCYGLENPNPTGKPVPRYRFDDGAANVWDGSTDAVTPGSGIPLYEGLFGETAKDFFTGPGVNEGDQP